VNNTAFFPYTNKTKMARKLKYNDEEGGMAKAQLQKIEMYAAKLNEMIHPEDELEGWVQNKLSVVAAYMGDVKHYLDYALQNEPEYKEFANGGMMDKPRYWEVEFTWDAADEESRKVNVMAESVSDAEEQVKKKFGPYYEGLKVVEVEEDKEITWDEYAKRPKKYETRSYSKEEMDEITRAQIKHDEEQLRREQGFADGGMVYDIEWKDEEGDTYEASFKDLQEAKEEIRKIRDEGGRIIQTWKYRDGEYVGSFADGGLTQDESDKLTKLQEEKDNLKMQELDISMGVKGGKKNWENKMRSINDEINTLLKKKYGWKMASGGMMAKGGKMKAQKVWLVNVKLNGNDVRIMPISDEVFDKLKNNQKLKLEKLQETSARAYSLDEVYTIVDEFNYKQDYASGGMMEKGGETDNYSTWNFWKNEYENYIKELKENIKADYDDDEVSFLTKQQEYELESYQHRLENHLEKGKEKGWYASGGMMKYEGSTEAEDFKEAEEYIGKDVWETLSKEDKLNATQYLKAKGVIGFYGQEEELADFMASQYAKGGSLYRGMRPSPSISATAYPRGFKMIGNDGNMWEISLDSRGVHRWTKSSSATRNDRTEQKAKIREAIELLESMRDEIDVEDEIATLKKLQ
jgi:hypothetical protein